MKPAKFSVNDDVIFQCFTEQVTGRINHVDYAVVDNKTIFSYTILDEEGRGHIRHESCIQLSFTKMENTVNSLIAL